ncbi:MAG: hypothetical protein RIC14_14890 [Filomicrobium sp.]
MKPSTTIAIESTLQLPAQLKSVAGAVLGWSIVVMFPAVFWTVLVSFIGPAVGVSISTGGLVLFAGSIALFLTLVYGAVVKSGTQDH